MFVAVVFKKHTDSYPNSHRPEGDWASFVSDTKEDAITKAITSAQEWGREFSDSINARRGPYQILVGELTHEAQVPTNYRLVSLA
jgi:hypothetical protein